MDRVTRPISVVEPHADDAFLSLGWHMEEWIKEGRLVRILTVYSATRRRGREAAYYASTIGAEWRGLGFIEASNGLRGPARPLPEDTRERIERESRPGAQIIMPLAVRHPEHLEVDRFARAGDLRYLDSPYHAVTKNSAEISAKLLGREVVSFRKPMKRKYRHAAIFKDQSRFFHYNPPDKLDRCVELIVR